MTKEEIINLAQEEQVKYIKLQFTDMLGTIKSVEVPVSKLESILENNQMFDGSSIEGFVRIKEADMYLAPDLNTFLILPLEETGYGRVARIICDVLGPDKKPFIGDPRKVLKEALKEMNELGFKNLNIGLEPEFYLFKTDNYGKPIMEFSDDGSYFDMAPLDMSETCRHDIVLELEKLGFNVEASHHEVGPGQNEINCRFTDALTAADNLQTFKQVVKQVASRHNLYASFMPKPVIKKAGNGMHVNCSLTNFLDENLFFDISKPFMLSDLCQKWMAGIIHYAREISLVTNPIVNSYKRLVSGYEAPCYICWSDANRSSMIRIPSPRGLQTRTEIRNVDTAANPYLAIAAILTAGLEGIKQNFDYVEPVYDNIFELTSKERLEKGIIDLPENLKKAIDLFKQSSLMKKTFGNHLFEKYLEAKTLEWENYRILIHPWELEKYL